MTLIKVSDKIKIKKKTKRERKKRLILSFLIEEQQKKGIPKGKIGSKTVLLQLFLINTFKANY